MQNDDSDMKIAGDEFIQQNTEDDSTTTALLLEKEKENGNLSRARRLGAIMADEVSAVEGDNPSEDAAFSMQRRILLAFAVEVGLEEFLPNTIVSQTAQSIFYDTLRQTASAFYEDLQESGAFSFYYLCIREGREVEKKVGKTFATLCGRGDDGDLADHGTELYVRFIEQIRNFVDSMEFIKE